MGLAATVLYDDRINHVSTLDDLDLGLIRAYLKQVKSNLFSEAAKMDFVQLCRRMNIVDGPDEAVRPRNVSLPRSPCHLIPSIPDRFPAHPDSPA